MKAILMSKERLFVMQLFIK